MKNSARLKEMIARAEEKIVKKTALIEKRNKAIEKKYDKMRKLGVENPESHDGMEFRDNNEVYWLYYDVEVAQESIKNATREIKETEKRLAEYRASLEDSTAQDDILSHLFESVPEVFGSLKDELVERWDKFDIELRDRIKKDKKEMEYQDFCKKYRHVNTGIIYSTDEEIHKSNVRDADSLILNFYRRVYKVTGEVTSWKNLYCTAGNGGWTTLNGYVEGKEGRAVVESIDAGGYNIQRYHIRVLVKECK